MPTIATFIVWVFTGITTGTVIWHVTEDPVLAGYVGGATILIMASLAMAIARGIAISRGE